MSPNPIITFRAPAAWLAEAESQQRPGESASDRDRRIYARGLGMDDPAPHACGPLESFGAEALRDALESVMARNNNEAASERQGGPK